MKKLIILMLLILTLFLTSCNKINDNIKVINYNVNQEFYFKKAISLDNYEELNDTVFDIIPMNKNTILIIKDKKLDQENSISLFLIDNQYIQILNSNIKEIVREDVFSNFKYIYKTKTNEEEQTFNIFLNQQINENKNNKSLYILFRKKNSNNSSILVYFEARK